MMILYAMTWDLPADPEKLRAGQRGAGLSVTGRPRL